MRDVSETRRLAGCEPERVLYYFENLSRIPRGSGNTTAVSAYCVSVAEELGLRCIHEEVGNVIIFKPATPGYEEAPAVILQGHLDMVAEKVPGSDHDFMKDPLDLFVEDGWIGARGTTLGGDDGIAVAYCLALLESKDIPHPALECVFTVEEETGMDGAHALDVTPLTGKYLINMDSEAEGTIWTSCAGGLRQNCVLPVTREETEGCLYHLEITGLLGGHSGAEIHKERGNAVILMGRVLYEISRAVPVRIAAMAGGQKDNAIPYLCQADVLPEKGGEKTLEETAQNMERILRDEYQVQDPGVTVVCENKGVQTVKAVCAQDTEKILFFLTQCPNGVQAMSHFIDGLVETSLNLGIMELTDEAFCAHFALRSSVGSRKEALSHRIEFLCRMLGASSECTSQYPEWKYRPESRLRDVFCSAYRDLTGKEMKVEAIHAGLECGLFDEKLEDCDMVSIGPDMRDIHTTAERLSIPSVERTWKLLLEVLRRLD